MKILDCNIVRNKILDDLKLKITKLNKKLSLVVIQISQDDNNSYLKQISKTTKILDYELKCIKLKNNIEEQEVMDIIKKLNMNNQIDGILIQFPIPKHLNTLKIKNSIHPSKDVDGITDINRIKLINRQKCLLPTCASSIIEILNFYHIKLSGKHVVIVGRSDLVGKPLASLFLNNDATVTICHSKTESLSSITKSADILVTAVGKSNLITSNTIKDGAIIIDIGINVTGTKISGDVDYSNIITKECYITPVPNGVGLVTVASLARNVYYAYLLKNNNIE